MAVGDGSSLCQGGSGWQVRFLIKNNQSSSLNYDKRLLVSNLYNKMHSSVKSTLFAPSRVLVHYVVHPFCCRHKSRVCENTCAAGNYFFINLMAFERRKNGDPVEAAACIYKVFLALLPRAAFKMDGAVRSYMYKHTYDGKNYILWNVYYTVH